MAKKENKRGRWNTKWKKKSLPALHGDDEKGGNSYFPSNLWDNPSFLQQQQKNIMFETTNLKYLEKINKASYNKSMERRKKKRT